MQTKHSPAEIAFLKAEIVARIRAGQTLRLVRAQLGNLSSSTVQAWLANDPEFRKAYEIAIAERGEARGRPPTPPADVAFMKAELPRLVGEEGLTVKDALKQLGISRELLRVWRKDDPAFDQRVKDAIEDLTEHEADRLKDLHTEILDPKVCKVASDNTRFWLEIRNAKMRPRAPVDDGNTQLAEILRSAVNRLIDRAGTPAALLAPATRVIELQPRRFDNGPPSEGT